MILLRIERSPDGSGHDHADYLPVVVAILQAMAEPLYNFHGSITSTGGAAPFVIVNGPVRDQLQMNSGVNLLGPGNRANATIGRALQLVVRNVGGGRPQEADQSTFGSPGKYTFCFAEDEDTPWQTLGAERGIGEGQSSVTLFTADGVQGVVDQAAREPEALIVSIASSGPKQYK